jgi:hypothetical protein
MAHTRVGDGAERDPNAPDAQSAQADFDGGTATAHWSASLGKVVLVAEGLPEIPADRTFELWYVRGDSDRRGDVLCGRRRKHCGAQRADATRRCHRGNGRAGRGSPDGTPTTTPVLAVPTA